MNRMVLGIGLAAACGGEVTDEDRVRAVLRLEGDVENGGVVYDERCAVCHGADGAVTVDLQGFAFEYVVETVVTPPPGMLTFYTLPDQDVADVAAFVESL